MVSVTENIISAHVESVRPPLNIREELDIGFSFKSNTLIIFEIRPYFQDRSRKIECPVIKARYIKTHKIWKIYWMRGNLKWTLYEPYPEAENIETIFKVLKEDKYGCFYG